MLASAFERVGNVKALPKQNRWRCTQKLAKQKLDILLYSLDGVLEGCGFEPREDGAYHNALIDAQHAGKVYMHLVKLEDRSTWTWTGKAK